MSFEVAFAVGLAVGAAWFIGAAVADIRFKTGVPRCWLWPFLLVAWLARSTVGAAYRHLTGRERRRREYQMRRHAECGRRALEWRRDARAFERADYPLSAAITANAADLFDALSQSFFDDANPQKQVLVRAIREEAA